MMADQRKQREEDDGANDRVPTKKKKLLATEDEEHQNLKVALSKLPLQQHRGKNDEKGFSQLQLESPNCVKTENQTSSPSSTASLSRSPAVASLQERIAFLERELERVNREHKDFLKDLRESVECPVCFNIPRSPPVPCCKNGHFICQRCKSKMEDKCPTCRTVRTDCVSQIASVIIQKIEHSCDCREEGCTFKSHLDTISEHEENCGYRLVRCPHWACDEMITVRNLTHHVIAAECGDSYRDKPLPYREEMVYTQELDDGEGNGFWKPSLLQFDGITFYLQVEKCGKSKNWYFYIQMEGSLKDCEKYGTMIKVSKNLESDSNSIVYNGTVCPIDIKGASEVEASGGGLNIRHAAMEKIFDINEEQNSENSDEHKGFKFYVDVDIYRNAKG